MSCRGGGDHRSRRRLSAPVVALGALVVALGALLTPAAALAAPDGGGQGGGPNDIVVTVPGGSEGTAITNAQFRWGLNLEAGAGAFAGGCNFLSAGKAGNSGGAVVWTESSGLYSARSGNARIEKPDAAGEFRLASFGDRCLDANGAAVSVASLTSATHNQVVIDGGVGRLIPESGVEIRWTGSFTVVFYGGMTYWSVSDPVLTIDSTGRGQVTATASGYAASMQDLTRWEPLAPQSIVLAELRSVPVGASQGFKTEPLYLGVEVANAGQAQRTADNAEYWGSFPASFVQFQKSTGQAGYWLTTNGQRDRAKVPTTLYISYDASAPISVAPPAATGGDGDPQNAVRQRPASAQSAAQASSASQFPLAESTTALPEGAGLLSEVFSGRNLLPTLLTMLSLSVSGLAVLGMKQMLPWQLLRRPG